MTSAEQQQFCLRWNNFQSNIISAFEYLRTEEDFVDVTLACEGRSLKAHKVILSACSQYFRQLLKTTPCQHPIIVLKDVCYEDLLSLMCFVYQGVVYIGQDRLTQFLKTAEFLQIKGLSEQNVGEAFSESAPASCMRPPSSQNSSGNIPALTPISDSRPEESTISPPFSSTHSSPTPSPVPRADITGSLASQQPTSSSRRKPVHPVHAFEEASQPLHCSEVKVEPAPICENGPVFSADSGSNGNGKGNGDTDCQDVALSLVSETSILRQRIEGSSPVDGSRMVDNNGIVSPGPLMTMDRAKLPSKLLLDPAALSMVGRDGMGFPFLPQPGTSSLMPNNVSTSNDEQLNAPNSPRYRQRWRCMQPSVCPHCMRTFSNAFNLKQHIINVHTFGNELKCEVCGKVQKNKWYLRKHMVKSHNAPLRRVKLPDGTMVNTE